MAPEKSSGLTLKVIFLIAITGLFVNCGTLCIKEKLIGHTTIERKFDENGGLIYYKKTNSKTSRFISHPHNATIIRTKAKIIEDHKRTVLSFQKTVRSVANLDGKVLKSKRIVWDENRRKTVTRSPKK